MEQYLVEYINEHGITVDCHEKYFNSYPDAKEAAQADMKTYDWISHYRVVVTEK